VQQGTSLVLGWRLIVERVFQKLDEIDQREGEIS
jgi:hypothetical protein